MNKICFIVLCLFAINGASAQYAPRHTIYEDSVLLNDVAKELSRSGCYYIPIHIQCDSTSESRLVLSTPRYLLSNYKKRKDISYDDFAELLCSTIKERKVLDNICIQDFEYLYGRDRTLAKFVNIVYIPQSEKFMEFYNSMDLDSLISWAFDSTGCYHRGFSKLPMIAERLLLYGIILYSVNISKYIYYEDIYKRLEKERQHDANILPK